MIAKPLGCSTCFMASKGLCAGFSNNEGEGTTPVLLVGEALGANELRDGLPFRPDAEAGSRLEKVFGQLGRSRSEFTLTNIVRGRPQYNKLQGEWYERDAIRNCSPYLERTIESARPKVIVALGGIAFRTLTGLSGKNLDILKARGYFIWSERYECWIIGTVHPSFVARGGNAFLPVLRSDVKKAIEVAEGKREVPRTGNYKTVHNAADMESLVAEVRAEASRLIAYDIETSGRTSRGVDEDQMLSIVRRDDDYDNVLRGIAGEIIDDSFDGHQGGEEGESRNTAQSPEQIIAAYSNSEIESIQFSLSPSTGYFIPYRAEFLPGIRAILASPNPKAAHNGWIFDNPILRRNGFQLKGIIEDTLWMWHHGQPDSPASLQFVGSFYNMWGPWKHLAAGQPELYGSADVDAVQRIMSQLPRDLQAQGLYDSYNKFVREFHPILEKMQDRGIRIDLDRRGKFEAEVLAECERIEAEIQNSIPESLHSRHPVDGFKVWPAPLRSILSDTFSYVNQWIPKKKDHILKFTDLADHLKQSTIENCRLCYPQYEWAEFNGEWRPFERVPFNPRSPLQLKAYLKLKGWKVPTDLTGKETTAKKELERLAGKTGDKILSSILELRKSQKIESTYVKGKGWKPGNDGKIHTTFTLAGATWQTTSRQPNIQNVLRHGTLATRFRECIVASPNSNLIECVAPQTRILKHNLTWAQAQHVQIGDELVGFDEQPVLAYIQKDKAKLSTRPSRYLRKSTVTATSTLKKSCIRIITDKGTVVCSKDHSWLSRTSGSAEWRRADSLRVGGQIAFFTYPWEIERSYEAGYLAGFLDGEGYCGRLGAYTGRVLGFGQNPGITLDKVKRLLIQRGFTLAKAGNRKCEQYSFTGQPFVWLRAIGMLRPIRLLEKAQAQIEGLAYWGRNSSPAVIIGIHDIGEQDVIAIETSTHTFIAEGLMSHNCDYKSFHALTLGFESEDAQYMRLARLDCHSFVAAHLLKLPEATSGKLGEMDDGWFREWVKWFKSDPDRLAVRDKKAKPAILGIGFGLGKHKLYDLNLESFSAEKEAGQLIELILKLFPRVALFQQEIRKKAHQQTYLMSKWGGIRRFNSVYVWDSKYQRLKSGEDSEKAVAFLPAQDAFGKIREAMIELHEKGLDEKYGMVNTVHDSLVFDCPKRFVDEAVVEVKRIMESPASALIHPQLAPEGLVCGVEVKMGESWGEMIEVKV